MIQGTTGGAWLLLAYQLPVRPSNARVQTWRRLQRLGAVAVKNSVYVLPNSAQAREDFEWVKAEIDALKGQASVFSADAVDAETGEEIAAQFRRARQQDYDAIRREAEKLLAGLRRAGQAGRPPRLAQVARALRERLALAEAADFFQASGREEALAATEQVHRLLAGLHRPMHRLQEGGQLDMQAYQQRIWVTRPRPGIDRMGSAWLIRRFIDRRAKFRFAEKPPEGGRAVPFDMYGVDFSHHGGECTFETLLRRFRLENPALKWLGRVVHQLDLKDEGKALPETVAVGRMVEGLRQMYTNDHELLEQGVRMFEALYQSYSIQPAQKTKPRKLRRSSGKAASR